MGTTNQEKVAPITDEEKTLTQSLYGAMKEGHMALLATRRKADGARVVLFCIVFDEGGKQGIMPVCALLDDGDLDKYEAPEDLDVMEPIAGAAKKVQLMDILSKEQFEECVKLYPDKDAILKEVITPNLAEINKKSGQDNDPGFIAYAVVYAIGEHARKIAHGALHVHDKND